MSVYLSLEIVKKDQDFINVHIAFLPFNFFSAFLLLTYFKAHFSCPEELSLFFNQGVKGIFHCKCFYLASVPINYVS